ncbi:MAG: T9SS type A sorting domain-containing protein [Bacteroidota bacterium]|nr:T9SS type A sorting domain-containing protein [Bacteroidota bacterium]
MKEVVLLLFISIFSSYKGNAQTISFTENKGQVSDQFYKPRPDVLFAGSANGMAFHLRNNGISYQLNRVDSWKEEEDFKTKQKHKVAGQTTIYRLDINWLGINSHFTTQAEKALEGYNNYYLQSCPNGALNVKSYQEVQYQQLYKGIDLKWYQKDGNLKYDYFVAAGADYKQIQLQIDGAEKISLNRNGDLIIKTPLGNIIEQAPLVKQNGRILKSKWVIKNNVISFEIVDINTAFAFVIDPIVAVRNWGTYYGGSGYESGNSCATDPSGNVYLAGETQSSNGTIIATVGSHQSVFGGSLNDAFIVKFNSFGVRQWGTYYGGAGDDNGYSCVSDFSGNIYLAGWSNSNTGNVIATVGSHQEIFGGANDAFLAKFNSNGIRQWATYYGGTAVDYAFSCTCDAGNNIYLFGYSQTTTGTVIATPGSFQSIYGGGNLDSYLVKFDEFGSRQWGTYYGGAGDEYGYCCATDGSGNIYLTGFTDPATGTVITTPGSHQPIYGGGTKDAFLTKFDNSGARLWGTYYGGSGFDAGYSCAIDASGNVFLAGYTNSGTGTIIASALSHQPAFAGGPYDSFLTKFNSSGVRQWGTYYGGSANEYGNSCSTDGTNVYLGGQTNTNSGTIIATPGSHQFFYGGGFWEAYLAKFNASGIRQWGTYYGGGADELISASVPVPSGNIFVSGQSSSGGNVATPGAHQTTYGLGNGDAFLVQFYNCTTPPLPSNTTPVNNQTICSNNSATLYATGTGTLNWFAAPASTLVLGTGTVFITSTLSAGTYSFYVEATTCAPSTSRAAVTLTVFSPVISVNSGSICVGQSFTLIPNGANSYTYSGGSSIVSPTVSTSYSVTGTGSSGCVSATPAVVTITVNPLPAISISNASICAGQSFTLNPSGANSYTFSGGSAIVNPTATANYTVNGTDSNGCTSYLPAVAVITVNPLPVLTTNGGAICLGQSFTINPTGANTYTFSGGSSVVSPSTNTSYSVYGTNTSGCVNSIPALSNVTVNPLPIILITTNDTLICLGASAILNVSGATNYIWSSGGTNTLEVVTPTVNTTYTANGTDGNGCQNMSTITVSVAICTGLNNKTNSDNKVEIYPNPNTGKFTIELNKPSQVSIYNILGQLIFNEKINELKKLISLSSVLNGTYFVRIETDNEATIVTRLIKTDD